MQACAQWWLVITRPESLTKLPEQPCARRTDDICTCLSQPSSGVNPYAALILSRGGLLKVHIPSSALAAPTPSPSASASPTTATRDQNEHEAMATLVVRRFM